MGPEARAFSAPIMCWGKGWGRWFLALVAGLVSSGVGSAWLVAQQPDIFLPSADSAAPVIISAAQSERWRQADIDLWLFAGNVRVRQGTHEIDADQVVVWVDMNQPDQVKRLIVYAEGNALVRWSAAGRSAADRVVDDTWIGRLFTSGAIDIQAPLSAGPPEILPPIIGRAQAAHAGQIQPAADTTGLASQNPSHAQNASTVAEPARHEPAEADPAGTNAGSMMISPQTGALTPSPQQPLPPMSQAPAPPRRAGPPPQTRVEINPRQTTVPLNMKTIPSDVPGEQILVVTGGVRLTIDSREVAQLPQLAGEGSKRVHILADNVVAWSNAFDPTQPNPENARWEVYLEGNVVFSVGKRTIYADRMYYDATYRRGTVLRAEFYTPAPRYGGLVRLKADVLQQMDENSFQAFGAAFTSSRIGVPRYWLQSDRLSVEGTPMTDVDPNTGLGSIDPETGQMATRDQYNIESRGNWLYAGSVPVFYWPRFQTSLDDPGFYLRSIRIGNDQVFGTQVRTRVDLYQLLGRRRPEGSSWIGALDYLSERGLGFGSEYEYRQEGFLGLPGLTEGGYRSWFIQDHGTDDLGADRRDVPLEENNRGMIYWNHRQQLQPGLQLLGEFGWISDRNFLEEYFQTNWDWDKDWTSGLLLERRFGNQTIDLWGQAWINDFFTQTTWAPRLDHFILGQGLIGNWLVYHAHSHAGYAKFQQLSTPTNPVDSAEFQRLAWETANAQGARVGTRQELDVPFRVGPVNLVPYVLGDATYWQQDLDGNDLFRVYGQTGLRASIPFWRIDPSIQSVLFNVNGLAHKVTFETEFAYADASQNWDRLPLYDPLDDDSQEFFRRRFAFQTFDIMPGMFIPIEFDERDFFRRSDLQSNVTAPVEIADDLMFVRFNALNRWQTKRGMPGRDNVIDWITFDTGVTIFPDADRDNFGEVVGLLNYDFRWFIGDRLNLVSDGFADFWSQGLKTISVGAEILRPGNGDMYVGIRSIEGPISSNVLMARMGYRMSDKWGLQALSVYDFSSTGNIGQRVAAIYIGESFLVRLGLNYDVSRDNFGVVFGVEPRFLARPSLFRPGGFAIPPASAEYLE
jgi:lipopolysaccharide export system protein LptA